MLTEDKLSEYLERHRLVATARDYIRMTRSSPPFRRVGDHAVSNVCVQFASRKMGRTIQAESRTAEYAFALEFEYSSSVLEFWDQPAPIPIARTLKGGGTRTSDYTPDFLVLAAEGPRVVEIKDSETLEKLVKERAADWRREDDVPTYLPANRAFDALGLQHLVCTTCSLPPVRSANLRLLLRARSTVPHVESSFAEETQSAFSDAPFMTLAALAISMRLTDLTPIIRLIEGGYLSARLSRDLLTEPSTCWVATDPSRLELVPEYPRLAQTGDGADAPRLPSSKSMVRYAKRVEQLKDGLKGRSERRWRSALGDGGLEGSAAFEVLLPKFDRCGNRRPRLNPKCEEFLVQFIRMRVASPIRPTLRGAFRLYAAEAQEAHPEFPAVSYATFRQRLLAVDPAVIAFGRGGRRAANAAALPSVVEFRALKATRAFESASLDHYNANISLLIGEANGKKYTARPWISGLVDVATGAVLAVWVSLESPSARACAIVIRRCVRIHKRLPESIIVDRGSDFRSLYFMSILASRGVDIVRRPAAHGRYGAEIERLFGLMQTNFLTFLPGNFAQGLEARAISSSHAPTHTAELTIEQFWEACLRYVDWHNATATRLGHQPPVNQQSDGLARFSCSGIPMEETPEFVIDTAVDVRRVKLEDKGYLRLNERRRFWTPELAKLRGRVRSPEVREEPENPHLCYVNVDGRWVTANGSELPLFESLDPISQFAESLRIRECDGVRIALREEAHREFLRSERARGLAAPGKVVEPSQLPPEAVLRKPERTIFEEVRELELAAFSDDISEVKKYVLGENCK